MELLLCHLEFQQYKQYASGISGITTDLMKVISVPQSSIITQYKGNNEMSDIVKLKYMVYDLYVKYVKIGSPFEINISYRVRNALVRLIDNRDAWINIHIDVDKLQNIFNACDAEISKLLRYSMNRAVTKPATLAALCEHLNIKHESIASTSFIELLRKKLVPVNSNSYAQSPHV